MLRLAQISPGDTGTPRVRWFIGGWNFTDLLGGKKRTYEVVMPRLIRYPDFAQLRVYMSTVGSQIKLIDDIPKDW